MSAPNPDDFSRAHDLKQWLRRHGISGRMCVRRDRMREGSMLKAVAEEMHRRTYCWFVGVERSQYEHAEALLQDNAYFVCREKTAQERAREGKP